MMRECHYNTGEEFNGSIMLSLHVYTSFNQCIQCIQFQNGSDVNIYFTGCSIKTQAKS